MEVEKIVDPMNLAKRLQLIQLAQQIALEISTGELEPCIGAKKIHDELVIPLVQPLTFRAWDTLNDGLDSSYQSLEGDALDDAIMKEAKRFAALDPEDIEHALDTEWRSFLMLKCLLMFVVIFVLEKAESFFKRIGLFIQPFFRGPKGLLQGRSKATIFLFRSISNGMYFSGWFIWCGILLSPILLVATMSSSSRITPVQNSPSSIFLLLMMLSYLGYLLVSLSKRFGAITAVEAMNANLDRAPILYLRSFEADSLDEGDNNKDQGFFDAREEEVLALIFDRIGPFVAVGDPGEAFLQPGASRAFLEENEWQENVLELMARSRIVLLRVSNTAGFQWEAKKAVSKLPPEKILFYFSQHLNSAQLQSNYKELVECIGNLLPIALPNEISDERFMRFEKNWQPVLFGNLQQARRFSANLLPLPIEVAIRRKRWLKSLRPGLKPFFISQGLINPELKMFSNASIGSATIMAGPAAAGIMMAKNLRRVGKSWMPWIVALVGFALSAFVIVMYERLASSSSVSELSAPTSVDPTAILKTLLIYLVINFLWYQTWKKFRSREIRQHLGLGGTTVHPVWSTILILGCTILWYTLIVLVFAPDVLFNLTIW